MGLGVSGNRYRLVSGRMVWLRKALVAVLCAVLGHLPLNLLIALAMCITALFVMSVGITQADVSTLIPDGQFESEGALGVAVDQSTSESDSSRGDVYVAGFLTDRLSESSNEFVPGRVNKFTPSGSILTPPSPIPQSGGAQFAYSGVAVNPVSGDVYALDAQTSEIDTYDPATGEPVSPPFLVSSSGNFSFLLNWTVVGIATDSAGDLYVPVVPDNKILEYDPATCPPAPEACPPLKTFTGGSGAGALKHPTAVAVDSAGNVWVADAGNSRIEELTAADVPVRRIDSEGVEAVALDTHGDVFATVNNGADSCGVLQSPCGHLVEYDDTGAQLADLGAGSIGTQQEKTEGEEGVLPLMVAVSETTGRVYVTEGVDNARAGVHSRVFKYSPPVPPTLESEVAVEVGTSAAKLGAVVNPGGISAAYRFEYGITTGYGHSVPFPEGDTGGGFDSRTVWAALSGLAPGTTYHYRAVVTSELGTPVTGEDRTFTTETVAQASCPNEPLRTGFSAALPDCRAYELVTPPNEFSAQAAKVRCGNGSGECDIEKTLRDVFAAPDGNRLAFSTKDVFPGSQSGGHDYLATRGSAGWSVADEIPPQNYYVREEPCTPLNPMAHSEDLSKFIFGAASGGICGLEPELIGGEPRGGTRNLYLRDNTDGTYQLIDITPLGATPADANFVGASADFSHVVFTEKAMLTPDALAGANNLYEWSAGQVQLVSLLANGTAVDGSFTKISADGSRVFFTAGGNLYARVHSTETVQLDTSQAAGSGGGGTFIASAADGSRILFSDDASAALTADTVLASGTNLYLYDFSAPADQRLSDLTPVKSVGTAAFAGLSKDGSQVLFSDDASAALTADTVPGSGANLYLYDSGAKRLADLTPAGDAKVEQVIAVSEDGSSVYFKAAGILTGSQGNQRGEVAISDHPNLYLYHAGTTTFITPNGPEAGLRSSVNGGYLVVESSLSLTGYDNIDHSTGEPDLELYFYNAAANSLACASCNPSGEPPTAGGAVLRGASGGAGSHAFEDRSARNLAENGRLFFNSDEGLLSSDTNGIGGCSAPTGLPSCTDVYEFEPPGVGTCVEAGGCVFLISTGTSSRGTFFIDASTDGSHVFIRELQKLVPADTQEDAATVYDVRVNGGLPEPAVPPPCITADACRAAPSPQPSIFGAGASQTFSGAGNLVAVLPAIKPKTAAELRAEKLAKALKVCRTIKSKKNRSACNKRARKKYGLVKKAKKATAKKASNDRRAK
jgi:hypothetical protein